MKTRESTLAQTRATAIRAAFVSVAGVAMVIATGLPSSAYTSPWSSSSSAYFDIPDLYCTIPYSHDVNSVDATGVSCDQKVRVRGKFTEFGVQQTTSWSAYAKYASRAVSYPTQQQCSN